MPPTSVPNIFNVSPFVKPEPPAAIEVTEYIPVVTETLSVQPVPMPNKFIAPPVYVVASPSLPPVIAPFRFSVFPAIEVISNKRLGAARFPTAMPAVSPVTSVSSTDVAPPIKVVATYL